MRQGEHGYTVGKVSVHMAPSIDLVQKFFYVSLVIVVTFKLSYKRIELLKIYRGSNTEECSVKPVTSAHLILLCVRETGRLALMKDLD